VSERISSGNAQLDRILGGGLPANAINVVMGLPGTGKTILAQQFLFENATAERPGLYLSTVSEPLEKILRYGESLSFFDTSAVGTRVFYEDLGAIVAKDSSLQTVVDTVTASIRDRRPGIIVIDSFKALHPYASDAGEFRKFLHELAGRLSAFPAASVWVGEYDVGEMGIAPEFAVADSIIWLATERSGEREHRALQVLKLRGSDFLNGKHAYRLTNGGLRVFPRLADVTDDTGFDLTDRRISSGIKLLDDILGDGYWPGASTLVAGPSGSGKTLIGLHFVFNGASAGEPGVIATLQENPTQLDRIARGFGWHLDEENVHVMYRTPVAMSTDEWVYELLSTIEETKARRVLIDSLGDLRAASPDEIRFREYIYSLLQRAQRAGVSVMMTQEVPELFGTTRLSEYGVSHLSDNVVLLQFVRGESLLKRAVTVIKSRATAHDPHIHEFAITRQGITIGSTFDRDQSWT
jgi:circadian clock protein KaiC